VKSKDFKDKRLSITFQQGQDFEFVKYSISKQFEVFQEKIVIKFFNFNRIFTSKGTRLFHYIPFLIYLSGRMILLKLKLWMIKLEGI